MSNSLIEKAVLQNWFFDTKQGLMTVQQVAQLPLKTTVSTKASLENVAQGVYSQLQDKQQQSFVDDVPAGDLKLTQQLEIVKQIIEIKKSALVSANAEVLRKQELQKLQDVMARKQDQSLESMSLEDIQKRITELSRG